MTLVRITLWEVEAEKVEQVCLKIPIIWRKLRGLIAGMEDEDFLKCTQAVWVRRIPRAGIPGHQLPLLVVFVKKWGGGWRTPVTTLKRLRQSTTFCSGRPRVGAGDKE